MQGIIFICNFLIFKGLDLYIYNLYVNWKIDTLFSGQNYVMLGRYYLKKKMNTYSNIYFSHSTYFYAFTWLFIYYFYLSVQGLITNCNSINSIYIIYLILYLITWWSRMIFCLKKTIKEYKEILLNISVTFDAFPFVFRIKHNQFC